MFSNLSQNNVLYILDMNGNEENPKLIEGLIERVSIPRPKYNGFSPNMEMVVDIIATVEGEKREFKGVPNGTIANFGSESFILAETKEALNSYNNAMLQNSRNMIENAKKQEALISKYEYVQQLLNPNLKLEIEKDKVIQSLQSEVGTLKGML